MLLKLPLQHGIFATAAAISPRSGCATNRFRSLTILYLTDNTSPEEILLAKESQFVKAVKYYPAGATTNSDFGVTDIRKCDRVFEAMQQADLPLLLQGEVTDQNVDLFDREQVFVERHLIPLKQRFPKLRVVLEHITTSELQMPCSMFCLLIASLQQSRLYCLTAKVRR